MVSFRKADSDSYLVAIASAAIRDTRNKLLSPRLKGIGGRVLDRLGVDMLKRDRTVSSSSSIHQERDVDCLLALMPAFRELVRTAEEAGWSKGEVAASLLTLASIHESPPEHGGFWH
jgi:hypothetical protein